MKPLDFKINAHDGKARTGVVLTPHGSIRTPAFVPVGTAASVKSLTPQEITQCDIDVFFVNTYHMLFHPGIDIVNAMGGLHSFMNWKGPLMTDSAGFQAFSLGEAGPRAGTQGEKPLASIRNDGIRFKSAWDGKEVFLGPRESIRAQQRLGADIMMAFDECTFYPIKKERAREAMNRTHEWLAQCLDEKKKGGKPQALYGIVQGSVFEDLRIESAKHVASLPVEGFAIGSVANSREPRAKVFSVLDWTMPYLSPIGKPIHFLGIGEIEDIFLSVRRGVDSLDCITPTRMGRMGWIFTKKAGLANKFRYDITKAVYAKDDKKPDEACSCYTCINYKRGYLHHLFRTRELLGYRLATIHNLSFFGSLMEDIRTSIAEKSFSRLQTSWLG